MYASIYRYSMCIVYLSLYIGGELPHVTQTHKTLTHTTFFKDTYFFALFVVGIFVSDARTNTAKKKNNKYKRLKRREINTMFSFVLFIYSQCMWYYAMANARWMWSMFSFCVLFVDFVLRQYSICCILERARIDRVHQSHELDVRM